jgi:hypothetical protein
MTQIDSPEGIARVFTYHSPFGDQPQRYVNIREHARDLALIIVRDCPASPERTLALRKLQEAVMFANASIAINEAAPGL